MELTAVDPEVAAATFEAHRAALWEGGQPDAREWKWHPLSPLAAVVEMDARHAQGTRDPYFVLLGAEYYDVHPPRLTFVEPESWSEASAGSTWLPQVDPPPGFGIHPTYTYSDGSVRQLLCFSHSLDFYLSGHNPEPNETWAQGTHTLAASLNRLWRLLGPEHYRAPFSPRDAEQAA